MNLEAKDANGFSDPYCMLGIIPGKRYNLSSLFSNKIIEEEEQFNLKKEKPHHLSGFNLNKANLIKRFNSFRKTEAKSLLNVFTQNMSTPASVNSSENNLNAIGAVRDKLPVSLVKTTDVIRCTLNPSWMEKFSL